MDLPAQFCDTGSWSPPATFVTGFACPDAGRKRMIGRLKAVVTKLLIAITDMLCCLSLMPYFLWLCTEYAGSPLLL
jgi:hypothetical protein